MLWKEKKIRRIFGDATTEVIKAGVAKLTTILVTAATAAAIAFLQEIVVQLSEIKVPAPNPESAAAWAIIISALIKKV